GVLTSIGQSLSARHQGARVFGIARQGHRGRLVRTGHASQFTHAGGLHDLFAVRSAESGRRTVRGAVGAPAADTWASIVPCPCSWSFPNGSPSVLPWRSA